MPCAVLSFVTAAPGIPRNPSGSWSRPDLPKSIIETYGPAPATRIPNFFWYSHRSD
jgi:hypothetical protein